MSAALVRTACTEYLGQVQELDPKMCWPKYVWTGANCTNVLCSKDMLLIIEIRRQSPRFPVSIRDWFGLTTLESSHHASI